MVLLSNMELRNTIPVAAVIWFGPFPWLAAKRRQGRKRSCSPGCLSLGYIWTQGVNVVLGIEVGDQEARCWCSREGLCWCTRLVVGFYIVGRADCQLAVGRCFCFC